MNAFLVLLMAGTISQGPGEDLLARLDKLGADATAEQFREFIHPVLGLEIDVAAEGSNVPEWVKVTQAGLSKEFDRTIKPLFTSGLFHSAPYCSEKEDGLRCTLITPASLPRICELARKDGQFFLVKLYWAGGETGSEDEEEDYELPL